MSFIRKRLGAVIAALAIVAGGAALVPTDAGAVVAAGSAFYGPCTGGPGSNQIGYREVANKPRIGKVYNALNQLLLTTVIQTPPAGYTGNAVLATTNGVPYYVTTTNNDGVSSPSTQFFTYGGGQGNCITAILPTR